MDLGLPSGTLWLDRLVGAQSPSDTGLFYQWGDIVGHSIADGYNFSSANYQSKGLNLISSDLDNAHDAARAYYGPVAKMPTIAQIQELIDNCVISSYKDGLYVITSNINGNSITIHGNGILLHLDHVRETNLYTWASSYVSEENARTLHLDAYSISVINYGRICGCNIMAVHS